MSLPTTPLDALLDFQPLDAQRVRMVFPEGWKQGRGLFGGLVTAALVRVLEEVTPQRALRSLTAELCGPLQPGEATLEWEVLRAGNAVTTTAIRIVQEGEVQAHGVGVLGRPRERVDNHRWVEAPSLPDWQSLEVLPVEPPLGPEFARFFEFRSTGPLPFSDAHVPCVEGFIRPKFPGLRRDAAFLAACVDAFWPALLSKETGPRPMATIAFSFQPFPNFQGLSDEAPLFFRSRLQVIDEGYSVEYRELWGHDGRLLALNQQTIVVIK